MFNFVGDLLGDEESPKPKYNFVADLMDVGDTTEPPESQKRAEALGRQHADEIFAGKFKTRTGVPIFQPTGKYIPNTYGGAGEYELASEPAWFGSRPAKGKQIGVRLPEGGGKDINRFINEQVNLGDLRDQNPQFDEPAYRRELSKRYDELYGAKTARDLAAQDATTSGKILNALQYVQERNVGTGTIVPNEEQRARAAGERLQQGQGDALDIMESIRYQQAQEAAKNRGVAGMVGETLSRAPAFIGEVELAGGLGKATALFGGLRAAQNYASGESALDAAKGFGREAITNAAFGAVGAAPGLNAGKRAAARADAGLPTTLGTLARDWAIDTPKVVAASNLGQEISYQAGLNPQGAPEGSAVKRVLQGDPHAKKELLAEVLAMGALEGGTRIPSALGILRNGPTPAPQKPPEPPAAATPAVEPVDAPKPAEAKIEPPAETPPQNGRSTSDLPPTEPWQVRRSEFEKQPGVLVHGTDSGDFARFDPAKRGSQTDEGWLGSGFYFSSDPVVAANRKTRIPANVDLKNPLRMEIADLGRSKVLDINAALGTSGLKGKALTEELVRRGFDGVILDYSPSGYKHREVVAFEPGQVTTHRAAVEDALAAGKPVPREVLADYPDLAASFTPPTEPPRTAQTATDLPENIRPARNISQQEARDRLGMVDVEKTPPADVAAILEAAKIDYRPETVDITAKRTIESGSIPAIEEQAAMRIRSSQLEAEILQARRDFLTAEPNSEQAKVYAERADQLQEKFNTVTTALSHAGTKWSDFGKARQKAIENDYSPATVEYELRKKAAKEGKTLDPTMVQESVKKAVEIAEKQAEVEALKNPTPESIIDQTVAESNNQTKKPLGGSKAPKVSWTEERIKSLEATAAESSKKLKDILSRLNSGVDPEIIIHLGNIAVAKIARGGYNAAKFTADIVKEFGEKARAYAGQAWEKGVELASEKVTKATDKARAKVIREELDPGLTKLLRDVLRGIVDRRIGNGETVKGTDARESIMGELHSLIPELDRPTLEDAVSGIGKFRRLSKDETSVAVRDIQGQLQQLGKLRYLAKGEMPPRTGTEKRDPSITELDLQKQYKDLLRESGIEATSPDQLRSTKDAIKARLQHDIESMDRQITEGQKLERNKGTTQTDPEIEALKAQRDSKKAEYDAIFGDPAIDPKVQAEKLIKSLDKQAETIKKQIESGDIYPDTSRADAARAQRADLAQTQPGVADAMERLNNLRQWKENLRNADVPRLIAEREAALTKRKADLERRIATNDILPGEKPEKPTSERIKRLEYETDLLKQDINVMRRSLEPKSTYKKIVEALNLPRPIQMGLEYSFVGIQGGLLTANAALRNPMIVARSLRDTLTAMRSDMVAWEVEKRIFDSPRAPEYRQGKLALTRRDAPLTTREETFLSRGLMGVGLGKAGKIPVLGFGIRLAGGVARGFERATNTYLNELRANTFDHMADALVGKGNPLSKQQAEMLGNAINVLSGRGEMGRFASAVEDLNTAFLAPRFAIAQIQTVIGQPLWKPLRKGEYKLAWEVTKTYLRGIAGLAALQGFISMFADETETDPRSSQFGSAKFGETTINVIPQMKLLSLGYRLTVGEKKSPLHGGIIPLRGENARRDIGDELAAYVRGKLSPVVGSAYSLWKGKDIAGKEATLAKELSRMIVPITGKDITDAAQSEGVPAAMAMAIPAFFGANLSTIRPEEEDALKHRVVPLSSNKPAKKPREQQDLYDARVARWSEEKRQAEVIARKGRVTFDSAKEELVNQWKKTGRSTDLYRDGKPTELKNRIDRLRTLLP